MQEKLCIFDSHSHYTDEWFDADRAEILNGMQEKGIRRIMTCGTDLPTTAASVALAEQYPGLLCAAAGIHPEQPDPPAGYLDALREFAKHPAVRAIGEIGLDYHYEGCDAAQQQKILREQLALARELDMPVILHSRDATGDMMHILREFAPLKGVMHCFSGSAETAREVLALGLYIGFTGVITFKNARKPLEAMQAVPAERLLIETDAPYMAPVPYRGKRCDSSMLTETAAVMAREKGVSVAEICRITYENAEKLFGR